MPSKHVVVLSTKAQWRLLVIGLVRFALLLLGALAYERVGIMQEQRHRLVTQVHAGLRCLTTASWHSA